MGAVRSTTICQQRKSLRCWLWNSEFSEKQGIF
jgi:hypothetical protein